MTVRYSVAPTRGDERDRVREFIVEQWGDARVVVHRHVRSMSDTVAGGRRAPDSVPGEPGLHVGNMKIYLPEELPGFKAVGADGHWIGLITYMVAGDACEIVTLDSLRERAGVGGALIDAVAQVARAAGCARLWLVTTNDNLHALGFYQRRGFRLTALRPGAVDESRRIKPAIPVIGHDRIPLRDELELERPL